MRRPRRLASGGAGTYCCWIVRVVLVVLVVLVVVASAASGGEVNGAPACPPTSEGRCTTSDPSLEKSYFKIDGVTLIIECKPPENTSVECTGNVTLDSDVLPTFPTNIESRDVSLRCPSLATRSHSRSYRDVLHSLNVSFTHSLELIITSSGPHHTLHPEHFRGLSSHLKHLTILSDSSEVKSSPALHRRDALFSHLTSLDKLTVSYLQLLPVDVSHLPTTLTSLSLTNVGIVNITAYMLRRLTRLEELTVLEEGRELTLDVGDAPRLTRVSLQAAVMPALSRLRYVTVNEWMPPGSVPPCRNCHELRELKLDSMAPSVPRGTLVELPQGWVAACPDLVTLEVWRVPLDKLPSLLFANATKVETLKMVNCMLASLPAGLFDDMKQLNVLDLSLNELSTLPSDIFSALHAAPRLKELILNNNRLRDVRALADLSSVHTLHLDDNPLGDLCASPSHDDSPLGDKSELRTLRLKNTLAHRVCPEWRRHMPLLETIDLSDNIIHNLTFAELVWSSPDVDMDLRGNPISRVLISRRDNITAINTHEINVDSAIECDCDSVMLQSTRLKEMFKPALGCAAPHDTFLYNVPPSDLRCDVAAPACPAPCRCTRYHHHVTVDCQGAGLSAVPALPPTLPTDYHLHLLLANNHITALHVHHLHRVVKLDIRNNSLTSFDAELLEALFNSSERNVLLAGNPLQCTCGARDVALADSLRRHQGRLLDAELVPCAAAHPAALCLRDVAPPAAAALLLAMLLALAAVLARPGPRRRLLRALRKLHLLPDTERRRFDVFLAFSADDDKRVWADELAARLELAGYRLCLPARDWAPGAWIPAQVAASVRTSRRTVALVSDQFLSSQGGLAALRQAHAAALRSTRPRLLAVLLAAPADLLAHPGCGADLRAFLASNTYLRNDDPYFWSKLVRALPRPSDTPTPAPAPAPAHSPAPDQPTLPAPDEPAPPSSDSPVGRSGLARVFPILTLNFSKLFSDEVSSAA